MGASIKNILREGGAEANAQLRLNRLRALLLSLSRKGRWQGGLRRCSTGFVIARRANSDV
jgi:hypothetical protein